MRKTIWVVLCALALGANAYAVGVLDYFDSLPAIAEEDFTGYGVGTDVSPPESPDGPDLDGAGAGLGTGFTGTWSGSDPFITDDRLSQRSTLQHGGTPPPSGTPQVILDTYGGTKQIARPLAVGLPIPSGTAEFGLSFVAASETISGRYGYGLGLLDADDDLLWGVSYDGNGSPVGFIRMYDGGGPNGSNVTARGTSTDDPLFAREKQWHHLLVTGQWRDDLTADLALYVDPTDATDIADYAASLSLTIPDDMAQLQIRAGDFNSVSSGSAVWDDIEFRGRLDTGDVIPEPASLGLLALGGLGLLARRRRRLAGGCPPSR